MTSRFICAVLSCVALGLTIATSPVSAAQIVSFKGATPGTIVVRTNERRLYLVLDEARAIRYPVGVGRVGQQWAGTTSITAKYIKPAWAAPQEIRRDKPGLPAVIPGGAPNNPMGAAALTLSDGNYAIHGTNRPDTIGGFVSYGCIRMHNADIIDLYERVSVGTTVVVSR